MSIVVAQLGARMYYAVPTIVERAGALEQLYTDICTAKGWLRCLNWIPRAILPKQLQRLVGRNPKWVPAKHITAFNLFGFKYALRLTCAQNIEARDRAFLWAGTEFGRLVVGKGFGKAKAVYAFNSAGLEILKGARRLGLTTILEQTIVPRVIERKLLNEEAVSFHDWEKRPGDKFMEEYIRRESDEWAVADLIFCGSDVVKEGITLSGGRADRCVVVPHGIERPRKAVAKAKNRSKRLRVLTIGAVGLRKGSPYVLAAARQLAGKMDFRMLGAIHILPEAEREMRQFIDLRGIVPRSALETHYNWADVFLLPSICEGSATVTYEAMFAGLPVICTPQTGSVIRDGIDGFIIPFRSAGAIIDSLERLASNPELLEIMSQNTLRQSSNYTLEKYGDRLLAILREKSLIE
jgi:glycosyltransferase involved in cell wall biosynthesis